MPAHVPDPLAEALGRVSAPDGGDAHAREDVTGSLADLWSWWHRVAAGGPVSPAWVAAPSGAVDEAIEAGLRAADAAIDSGATVLVPRIEARDGTTARALIAVLTRREASAVLDQPGGMTDREWMTACAAVRDRIAEITDERGEPVRLMEALSAGAIAGTVGLLIGAAARRTPVLVDGTDELAAALVADRLGYRAKSWWRAGSTSSDPGRTAAVDRMDLEPGLPLLLDDDEGLGAQSTLALLNLIIDAGPEPRSEEHDS